MQHADHDTLWKAKSLVPSRFRDYVPARHPALRYGEWRPVWSEGETFAFIRETSDERILVAINRGKEPVTISASVETAAPQLLWGEVNITMEAGGLTLHNLGAWAGAVHR